MELVVIVALSETVYKVTHEKQRLWDGSFDSQHVTVKVKRQILFEKKEEVIKANETNMSAENVCVQRTRQKRELLAELELCQDTFKMHDVHI